MADAILGVPTDELRSSRTSVKWRAFGPDVLPLFIAEMDVRPCPAVVTAVSDAVSRGDTGYAWTAPYVEAFTAFADRRWGWQPDPEATVPVADVLTGITTLLRLLTAPGGPVVVSSPVYNAFHDVVAAAGRRVVEAPLRDGRLDVDALRAVFADLARAGGPGAGVAYLLCNPHNPTGHVPTAAELAALAEAANEFEVRVVSDEIHAPLTLDGVRFTPWLTVPGADGHFTVTSAGKTYNLAGLKAGLVVAGAAAVDDLRRIHPYVTYGASHLGTIAQAAAWAEGDEWLDRLLGELAANRATLVEAVASLPGVTAQPPEATYLAWLDLRATRLGDEPAAALRERARVALSEGTTFGAGGAGHARLNFATSPEILREALDRITGCLA
ncbi:MalY/PatB family protein [Terracoccus luteus]|uniref:cysteine-S-conjugate beta-lyase n=1 Tax=Terracoccus luteus TaxID=53356 RepID=A0A839PWL4_9MICO|nr:aminotransferase class I/II-fold pyridoxal phosphate-dependent enzyme [Terracoccus luteus]MBB2987114.1 cystathionine beta-lyase [Terracoccus luteus]MCP2172765.1 cystathionine beta-lyase [Terracoccus luteus]